MNILRFIFTTLLLICSVKYLAIVFGEIFLSGWSLMFHYLQQWAWVILGAAVYTLVYRWIGKYMKWFEVFSHEFTHTIIAWLSFNKVTEFVVNRTRGHITYEGKGSMLLNLSPYCLPTFTFIMLCFHRLIPHEYMVQYEFTIGITLAFHFFCFKCQTGNWQTDINNYPKIVSYLFIVTLWVVNTSLILVALSPNQNLLTSAIRYVKYIYFCAKPYVLAFLFELVRVAHNILTY